MQVTIAEVFMQLTRAQDLRVKERHFAHDALDVKPQIFSLFSKMSIYLSTLLNDLIIM
jgi:hypothetical protein